VLLEKPVATSAAAVAQLSDVLSAQRVGSILFLTYRFSPLVASFVADCQARTPVGAQLSFFTATHPSEVVGWRREHGVLLDLGFHVFDLLDAAVGRIARIAAHGDRSRWAGLFIDHTRGCFSEASICWAGLATRRTAFEVFTEEGNLALDPGACVRGPWLASGIRRAVWARVREGRRDASGIERGLYLQQCVDAAEHSLRLGGRFVDVARRFAEP
jgi:predicted dehydrogenase